MKKKTLKYVITAVCTIVVVYFALTAYNLMTIDIENLISCSLHPETNRYPSGVPEFFLFNFRGNDNDIKKLDEGKGLDFILSDNSISSDKALKYASFFLEKGADINSIGFDGFTALHNVIVNNKPKYVSFLLEHGADINIKVNYSSVFGKKEKTKMHGMNAIELAIFMSSKDGQDRSAIIKLLKNQYSSRGLGLLDIQATFRHIRRNIYSA